MTIKNEWKTVRSASGWSLKAVAKELEIETGKRFHQGKIHRFEAGTQTRDKADHKVILSFYQRLQSGKVKAKPIGKRVYKTRVVSPPKLAGVVNIKDQSNFLSTDITGEGIMFLPEGQYMLVVDDKGTRFYPLQADANPCDKELERLKAELARYKHGHDSWLALKDLVRD